MKGHSSDSQTDKEMVKPFETIALGEPIVAVGQGVYRLLHGVLRSGQVAWVGQFIESLHKALQPVRDTVVLS